MRPVTVLRAASNDILDQSDYYDLHGGFAIGDRFRESFQVAFDRIAEFPRSGTIVRSKLDRLAGCRFALVPEFERIMIFYRILADEIEIVRVVHSARDLDSALNDLPAH